MATHVNTWLLQYGCRMMSSFDHAKNRQTLTSSFCCPAQGPEGNTSVDSGGMLSSVTDLVRVGSANLHPAFLGDSTIRAAATPQRLTSCAESPVGIGWRIGVDDEGRRIWHHSGASIGRRATLVVGPDEGRVVAIAGNMNFSLSERTAFRFTVLAR